MSVPGRLNNLCQEVQSGRGSRECWYAYSAHLVIPAAIPVDRRASQSSRRSVSISPKKQQKVAVPKLYSWSIRVNQIIQGRRGGQDSGNGNGDVGDGDSDTESESDGVTESSPLVTAWYTAHMREREAAALLKESGDEDWSTLELRIRVAWDGGCIDVLASEDERLTDGSYSCIKLSFDLREAEKNLVDREGSSKANVEIVLRRLKGAEELEAASIASSKLVQAFNALKGQTESLRQERDGHRKLLQTSRRQERYKESNSSLVNPGRLKRKTEDDGGFEGDDDEMED